MKRLKFITLVIFFLSFVFSNNACTKEQDNNSKAKNQITLKKSNEITLNNDNTPLVLDVKSVSSPQSGKALNFTWEMNGKTYSFAEYTKGKVVLLNFWATWCGPCRMEIPSIIELDKELPDKDFVVIGVALDNRGTLEQVRSLVKNFAKVNGITYINFLPTQDIISPYGNINSIPTTFIIDRKGNIVEKIIGARSKKDFYNSIMKAMKS